MERDGVFLTMCLVVLASAVAVAVLWATDPPQPEDGSRRCTCVCDDVGAPRGE